MKYLLFCLLIALTFGAYNTHSGLDLAYFSKIAYDPISNIGAWNCGSCSRYKMTDVNLSITQVKAFTNSSWDMQGYVGYSTSHNAVIVSFRGSSNIKNWISDFDAAQVGYSRCSGCNVHRGFFNSYNTVASFVKAQVSTLLAKYRNAPIYVTGHSLGGAIAIVAALDIHATYGNSLKLYTYGEPRVGNAAFASYVNSAIPDTFRVVHYADIVPHLPPAASNYKHVNSEVWYTEDMKSYKVCAAEDGSCSNSRVPNLSTSDHDISNYIRIVAVSQEKMFNKLMKNLKRAAETLSDISLLLNNE